MKKVIFICLLSVSCCLSLPSDQQGAASAAVTTTKPPGSAQALAPINKTEAAEPKTDKSVDPTVVTTTNATNTAPNATTNSTPPQTNASQAAPTNATVKPTDDNKTTQDKKPDEDNKEKKVEPSPAATNGTVTPTEKSSNGTKVPDAVTTKAPVTEKPSENTSKTPPQTIEAARGFDGASFIGGIILTLGLLAIGFMGFKYYRNQTERNYHTL